jgi:cytoskeletal protein CcmA (bactofilin family)
MWKKDDVKPEVISNNLSTPASTVTSSSPTSSTTAPLSGGIPTSSRAAACISQGIKIKGELTGSEDLFVDGVVEGKLNLTTNSCLTIGPNGQVKADVSAREVIVRGKIEGKVVGRDKVQIWSTGQITGEVTTDRLAIEDGALLRGRVEAGKLAGRALEVKAAAASANSKSAETITSNSGTVAD